MPAPMGVHGDNQRKPTAPPSSEINLDMNGGAGHSGATSPVIVITDDNKRNKNNHKRQTNNKQRSNAVCTGFSVVLVIFCCVITGLEVSFMPILAYFYLIVFYFFAADLLACNFAIL